MTSRVICLLYAVCCLSSCNAPCYHPPQVGGDQVSDDNFTGVRIDRKFAGTSVQDVRNCITNADSTGPMSGDDVFLELQVLGRHPILLTQDDIWPLLHTGMPVRETVLEGFMQLLQVGWRCLAGCLHYSQLSLRFIHNTHPSNSYYLSPLYHLQAESPDVVFISPKAYTTFTVKQKSTDTYDSGGLHATLEERMEFVGHLKVRRFACFTLLTLCQWHIVLPPLPLIGEGTTCTIS